MKSPMESQKNRGNYKCGRCGVPKKGHKCPYLPKLKRSSKEIKRKDAGVQCEFGEEVVRGLVGVQGTEESYLVE